MTFIDAQCLKVHVRDLVDRSSAGKTLTKIYVTHAHPDPSRAGTFYVDGVESPNR